MWYILYNSLVFICQWEHGCIIVLNSSWGKTEYPICFIKFNILSFRPKRKITYIFLTCKKSQGSSLRHNLGQIPALVPVSWQEWVESWIKIIHGCFCCNHINTWVEQFCASKRNEQMPPPTDLYKADALCPQPETEWSLARKMRVRGFPFSLLWTRSNSSCCF